MEEEKLVICKVCGYIMKESDLKDVCPACGVQAKAFEPYKPKVSKEREKILSLHMHPIILHFPQAVVVFAFLLNLITPFFTGAWKEYITICARFNVFLLPLCILGGFVTGLIDGKIRFKSVIRPILITKMYLSGVFFTLSLIAAVIMYVATPATGIILLLDLVLFADMAVAIVLGRIGSRLTEAVYPGKM